MNQGRDYEPWGFGGYLMVKHNNDDFMVMSCLLDGSQCLLKVVDDDWL